MLILPCSVGAFIGIAIDWVWTQATLDPVSGDKSKEAQPKSEKQRKEAKKSKSENKKKDAKKRQPRNVTDAITTPWRESYEALGDSRRFVVSSLFLMSVECSAHLSFQGHGSWRIARSHFHGLLGPL